MIYEYWLALLKGISAAKKYRLREHIGSAQEIYNNIEEIGGICPGILGEKESEALKKADKRLPEEEYRRMEEQGITFVHRFSGKYPERLKNIPDPPYAIYVKGSLPDERKRSAAIVGARKCTPYGEALALEYGEALARAGLNVISGMARGIDGAGQRGALNGGGSTYAVLGCGVDVCYPRENIGLYTDILKRGGILSELPPGEKPLAHHFPARNRIISALSDVVLVMEAEERSGSLITADAALEQGKDVYALPGSVRSPQSLGCHRLIRQGAGILTTIQDLLDDMNIIYLKVGQNENKNKKILESANDLVYSCLDFKPKGVNELAKETGLMPNEVLGRLVTLQMEGSVREISKNYYVRIR